MRKIFLTALLLPFLAMGAGTSMRSSDVTALSQFTAPASSVPAFDAVFTPDGKMISRSDDGKLLLASDPTRDNARPDTLINLNHTRETTLPDFEDFTLSPDGSKILLRTESRPVYRHSVLAKYYVYERRTRLLRPLSREHEMQRDPVFSPDSRMVAFVADNNIYCAKLDYQTEVPVTTDGTPNAIINGAADWTYEEEFSITSAITWAPDNLTLSYLRWDETAVPAYTLPLYEGTCDPMEQYRLYPGVMEFKYPVAGQPNAKVTLHCYDVETRKTTDTQLPGDPYYIPRIQYAPSGDRLLAVTLNRDQNNMEIFSVNPKSTVCRSVYSEQSRAWIIPEAYENLTLEENSFVVASDRDGYTRFYRYSYTGTEMEVIGAEGQDATEFYGTDAAGNVYYQAAAPTAMDRTIYRRDRRGAVSVLGNEGGTSSAVFDPAMAVAVVTYSDAATVPSVKLYKSDGRQVRILQDNADYAANVTGKHLQREFFTMVSDGNVLNGYIIKPADAGAGVKYPVIMSQYSGPGSQSVLNRWSFGWEDYYAANGFVIVCVDGRGTGGRGADFRTCVYRRLGHFETIDQIAAARHAGTLPYADASRIGIYGWSYGGYEALMAASAAGAPYAAAVAIAPVTDWRLYDTVYTERYMLTPQQNEAGYNAASALERAENLSCPLLNMYGTMDDNVHPANTLQYVSRLQAAGILSDMYVFPNMNHSINGCNARAVVYGRMFRFFKETLR